MKLKLATFLFFFSVILFTSCKKDSNETPNVITGSYKFIHLSASTVSAVSYMEAGTLQRAVTYSEYTTKSNTGSLEIDGRNMKSTGLSYAVDTITRTDYYEDNEWIDSFETPFKVNIPASDGTTGYKIITGDSIYVTNGSMFSGGTTTSVEPTGMKYRIEGDKLIFNLTGAKSQTMQQAGVTMLQEINVKAEAVYQKQ